MRQFIKDVWPILLIAVIAIGGSLVSSIEYTKNKKSSWESYKKQHNCQFIRQKYAYPRPIEVWVCDDGNHYER